MLTSCLLYTVVGYLSGSIMFAVWLAKLRGRDVRAVGDKNPGAINAYKAAGPAIGTAALLLDFLKGALPVAAAILVAGLEGWWLVPVIIAPVVGHAFPVFQRFRGGKAIDVTFGVWAGVTIWEVPTVMGAAMAVGMLVLRFKEDAKSMLLGMIVLVPFVAVRYRSLPMTAAALLCASLVVWRHRRELAPR